MDWGESQRLWWLILVPFMVLVGYHIIEWRKKNRQKFADNRFWNLVFQLPNYRGFWLKLGLIVSAFTFLIFAFSDPLFGESEGKVKREGLDLVVALDLSKSMNAKDVAPSRLKKAKKIIDDLLDQLGGDRVGLVIFAGEAFVASPLTSDYIAIKTYLNALTTDLISSQGTNLSEALKESLTIMNDNSSISALVLISDGEDHEQNFDTQLKALNAKKVSVMSIGVGTEKGAMIEEKTRRGVQQKRNDEGEIIISKLQEKSLKKIARETQGSYLLADASGSKAAEEIMKFLNTKERKEMEEKEIQTKNHIFQWFLAFAFIILIMDFLTTENSFFNRAQT